MVFKFLFGTAPYGSEWAAVGRLLLPFFIVSLFGAALTYLIRKLGWLPAITSIAPISIMLGALSYVVIFAIDPMIAGSFTLLSIWNGALLALIVTWPIALVVGPLFFLYIAYLKKGRKVLSDSAVFYVSVLTLVSEALFLKLFLDDPS
jgi:hypothetical protein